MGSLENRIGRLEGRMEPPEDEAKRAALEKRRAEIRELEAFEARIRSMRARRSTRRGEKGRSGLRK